MIRRSLIATVLVGATACAPTGAFDTVLFESPCGMRYLGSWPDAGSPTLEAATFAKAEFVVMDSFYRDDLFGLNYEQMCDAVWGWRLYTSNESAWIDERGRGVFGLTHCGFAVMQLGKDPIAYTAYPHELAHVLQRCDPSQPEDPGTDREHADWYRRGVYAAIENATNRLRKELP